MRALTFNVWHGLAGYGVLRFAELEPEASRAERGRLLEQRLHSSAFDILFFQELNPVDARVSRLAGLLNLDECHCVDQSGLKIFGHGIPSNLRSGLGIFTQPALEIRSLGSLCLSGVPWEFVGESMSLQLHEQRFAIFAEIKSQVGGRILLANAHMHHGFETSPEFINEISGAVASGVITAEQENQIIVVMNAAETRRASECARMLERIEELAKKYDSVLIGCDLNSTPQGSAYVAITKAGFVDVYASARGGEPLDPNEHATWNPERNSENRKRSPMFRLPMPDFAKPEVTAMLRQYDQRPRRIDFLFARGALADAPCVPELWADKPIVGGVLKDDPEFISDHFGVSADWSK